MDVRRPLLDCVKQHFIDKLYDWRVISEFRKVRLFRLFLDVKIRNVIFSRGKVGDITVKHLILLGYDLADSFQQLLLLNND